MPGRAQTKLMTGKREAARQQQDIDHWKNVYQRVERKLLVAFQSAQLEHPGLLERLQLPTDVLCSYHAQPPAQVEEPSSSHGVPQSDDPVADVWPSVQLAELAGYLRRQAKGTTDEASFPTETAINIQLESLMMNPERWDDLPADQLANLFVWAALRLAFTGDVAQVAPLARLYQTVAKSVPLPTRRQIVDDVSLLLDSDVIHLQALVPIIFNDPDQYVISTAALNLATISPLSRGDLLTGPKRCLEVMYGHGDGTDMTTVGVLTGLLALGDRRVLPLLDGIWHGLSRDAQFALTTASCDWLYSSTMEFWLRWLENVEEEAFGYPAHALKQAPLSHASDRVLDVRRRFPAPRRRSRNGGRSA